MRVISKREVMSKMQAVEANLPLALVIFMSSQISGPVSDSETFCNENLVECHFDSTAQR
jgi:phosphate/sulfate permease